MKANLKKWHFILFPLILFTLLGYNGNNGLLGTISLLNDEIALILLEERLASNKDSAQILNEDVGEGTSVFPKYSHLQDDEMNRVDLPEFKFENLNVEPVFPLSPTSVDIETGSDNY